MGTVRVERCPDCEHLVGEGGLYQHRERHCEKRKPQEFTESFLAHAVMARSQYQPIVRDMAAEILRLRRVSEAFAAHCIQCPQCHDLVVVLEHPSEAALARAKDAASRHGA